MDVTNLNGMEITPSDILYSGIMVFDVKYKEKSYSVTLSTSLLFENYLQYIYDYVINLEKEETA